MRQTIPALAATHTMPAPAAIASGRRPGRGSRMVATTRSEAGSIRDTVPLALVTQTAP